jgi:hypothetical protein
MALVGFEKTSEELGNNNKKNIYFLEIPIHFILDLDLRALSLSLILLLKTIPQPG